MKHKLILSHIQSPPHPADFLFIYAPLCPANVYLLSACAPPLFVLNKEERHPSLSTRLIKKTFFFFYPHALTFRLKRPVYRGFSGESKCEGKCFTLTLTLTLTLTPSHPYSSGKKASCLPGILWMGVRFNGQGAKKQRFTSSIAMVYCWCSYAALQVQLCCTFGARMLYSSGTARTVGIPMLDCWYSYAEPLVYLC